MTAGIHSPQSFTPESRAPSISSARHKINFSRLVMIGFGGRECLFILTRIG
jgi:hypothetical protein